MKKLILLLGLVLLGSSWVNAQAQSVAPPYNMPEKSAYSLFVSKFRNDNYQGALKFGRWILLSMPESIKNVSTYDLSTSLGRFVTIYTNLAKNTTNPSMRAGYIDTVQIIFDKVSKLPEGQIDLYTWKIRQGRFYHDHADLIGKNAQKKALKAYTKAFELNPKKMATSANGYYLKVLLRELAEKGTKKAQKKAVAMIAKTEPYANKELSDYFDEIRKDLFDKPAERIAYLESKLEENPESIKVLRQLRNIYLRQGKVQKARDLNKKLYKLNPTYTTTVALAKLAMNNANYQEAIKYYKEALNKTDDSNKLKTIYFKLATAAMNIGNMPQAANYAKEAINEAPDWGRPYLKLATIYARTINNCVSGKLSKEDKAVYWLVLDYVQKAKRVDPSVSDRANSLIQTYSQYTPSKQDVFFSDEWEEGGTVNVSSLGQCYSWINENTTVR